MLEIIHGVEFPFDEAGHLCHNPLCINPDHLEIQTPAYNLNDRRRYRPSWDDPDRMIPILYPIEPITISNNESLDKDLAVTYYPSSTFNFAKDLAYV